MGAVIPFEQLNRGNGRSTAIRVPGMPTKEQRRNRRGGPDSFERHEVCFHHPKSNPLPRFNWENGIRVLICLPGQVDRAHAGKRPASLYKVDFIFARWRLQAWLPALL